MRNCFEVQDDALHANIPAALLSPALVDKVIKQGVELLPEGELVTTTVLFRHSRLYKDVSRGCHPAHREVGLLNEYFEQVVEVVFTFGARWTIMGDGLMAVWDARPV